MWGTPLRGWKPCRRSSRRNSSKTSSMNPSSESGASDPSAPPSPANLSGTTLMLTEGVSTSFPRWVVTLLAAWAGYLVVTTGIGIGLDRFPTGPVADLNLSAPLFTVILGGILAWHRKLAALAVSVAVGIGAVLATWAVVVAIPASHETWRVSFGVVPSFLVLVALGAVIGGLARVITRYLNSESHWRRDC
jgi:hypothetical protein